MSVVSRHVIVAGRVQGVGFRWSTQREARALGVRGWVRNLPDGRVEARLVGASTDVEALLAWLRRGPTGARVDALEVREGDPEGASPAELDGFDVRR